MTRIIAFFSLLAGFAVAAVAQPTITTAAFVAAGDSIPLAIDDFPSGVLVGEGGENRVWNFTGLSADTNIHVLVRPASQGSSPASFPTADLVLISDGGEAYYKVNPTSQTILGFVGSGGFPLGLNVTPRYAPPLVEQRAPMAYFDVNTAESALQVTFSASLLPDSLLSGLPFTPDSIRFSQSLTRLDVVDGWGKLQIPGGEYDVLRERRRTISDTKIEILLGFFWLDLSTVFPLPGLGADTTLAYHYYSNSVRGPVAVADVDPDNPATLLQVQYLDLGVSSTQHPVAATATIFQGPRPAVDVLRFDLGEQLAPASLEIISAAGQVLLHRQGLRGQELIPVGHLPAGLSFYRLSAEGRVLETGPLLIQR